MKKGVAIIPQIQETDWDCGLCCVAMVTNRKVKTLRDEFERETGCKRVWTVELLRFLDKTAVYATWPTASYSEIPFYADIPFEEDCKRIAPLMVNNEPRHVSTAEIAQRLREDVTSAAIVLVCNNRLLKRKNTDFWGHCILCVSVEAETVSASGGV